MKILIAPDKFKGSLSAKAVCEAIGKGIKKRYKTAETIFHPMADGGDGSLEVLAKALQLNPINIETMDPFGRKIDTRYFTSGTAAFIELASASGLALLQAEEYDPTQTSTFGTGIMVADAIGRGYPTIYLFLGGSATNDAGTGIASAMGIHFLDKRGAELPPIGQSLPFIETIKRTRLFNTEKVSIILLCDVTNPLYGHKGAAFTYAPQKGGTEDQVRFLDEGLKHISKLIRFQTGIDVNSLPGIGAAGGVGASLAGLFGAQIISGFDIISELTDLEKQIKAADLIISGEGRLDAQTLDGKVVYGIAKLCRKHNKPLVLFAGKNDLSKKQLEQLGVRYIFPIYEIENDEEKAIQNAAYYLEKMASNLSFE